MTDYATAINWMIVLIDKDGISPRLALRQVKEDFGHKLTESQNGTIDLIAKNWQGQRMVDGLDDIAKDRELEDLRADAAADEASIYAK